jgi:thiamine kinase-like enzyme
LTLLNPDFGRLRQVLARSGQEAEALLEFTLVKLRCVFEEVAGLEIPNTLVHFDATPGNLFLDDGRLRLIDFDLAGWGFPFLTLETLLRSEEILMRGEWVEELKQAYLEPWRDVLDAYSIHRAMELTPVFRVWMKLRRLLDYPFEYEPEQYWHPTIYKHLLIGFLDKLYRLVANLS